jgi:ribonucleotide reductase alpha subunit
VGECYEQLRAFDKEWSSKQGINPSIKLTTVKPSGTLSLLAGVTPGIHPAYSQHYIRRVRMGSADPLVNYCRDKGYDVQYDVGLDGKENHTVCVVSFPCETPEHATLAKDLTAVQQLEWVVKAQSEWADNNVSVTVYYRKEELPEIQEWMKKNYKNKLKSVSFLLHSDHGFALAPYEEIDVDTYNKLKLKIKEVTFVDQINEYALEDLECEGGACPIR